MRILILNRVEPPAPGATGRIVHELAEHLRAKNHCVETITTGKLPAKMLPYILSWFSIGIRALFAPRADRVVVMTDPPMLALWIPLLKFRHAKIIHWCQDLYPDAFPVIGINMPPVLQSILIQMNRTALQCADKVITLGQCMADRLKNYVQHITIIPNWPERDLTPVDISITEPLKVLYAGNIGMVHPAPEIARAIQSCADLPVKFILMTGGKGEQVLRDALAAQTNVTFLPPQPWERAKQIQSECHVHLIALKDEALGIAMPVKTYAAIQNARPYIFLGPEACEAARLIRQYDCGDIISNQRPQQLRDILQSYSNPDGTPSPLWQDKMQKTRAISLPDSLSQVAEAILAA